MEVFLELICEILAEIVFAGVDWFSWKKGRSNRIARRVAKLEGKAPPKRDPWGWVVTILTPIVIMLGVLILVALVVRFAR